MFFFWKMVFNFQVNYHMFIRSEREGNFRQYILALRKLIKWHFIFDNLDYSGWLSVHLFDLITVETMFQIFMKILIKESLLFKNQKTTFLRWILIKFLSRIIAPSNPVIVRQILSIKWRKWFKSPSLSLRFCNIQKKVF